MADRLLSVHLGSPRYLPTPRSGMDVLVHAKQVGGVVAPLDGDQLPRERDRAPCCGPCFFLVGVKSFRKRPFRGCHRVVLDLPM